MITLRPYQENSVQKGVNYFLDKKQKPAIMVLPTAAGKSIIISSIANNLSGKTIVLQPSVELLRQNLEKLIMLGGEASVYSASAGQKEFGKITYATIGSIKSLGHTFREKGYTNVIVDEANLYPPNSDSMFGGFIRDLGITSVLGLTATPFRLQNYVSQTGFTYSQLNMITSRKKGGGFFKNIIHVMQIREIVEMGYWSKLKYQIFDFDSGGLKFNSTGADYTEESMQRVYDENEINKNVSEYVKGSDRKSILVFVPKVNIAMALSAMIPSSTVVYGDMDKRERAHAISEFRKGNIRVAINVNVLSVGFDHPEIDCVILARPTASLAWLYQAAGRGTRISEKKDDCLIVDFVGNIPKFGMLEDIEVKEIGGKFMMFGSGNKLLTEVPLNGEEKITLEDVVKQHEPKEMTWPYGKFKGTLIADLDRNYIAWVLENFTFNQYNKHLKDELKNVLLVSDAEEDSVEIVQ